MLNLVQLQERLKDVPMQALMQYANGMNPQIPPFIALGELNRRKKMQESAAAEQAKEMAGAPSVKEQIEQASGLLALQGSRQRQAAQQQAGIQAAMPMAAPNTMTSEPVQMASGGAVDDVMSRDYMGGGLTRLPMRPRMFARDDYADGGIVAFAGTEGSYVDTSQTMRKKADQYRGLLKRLFGSGGDETIDPADPTAMMGTRPSEGASDLAAVKDERDAEEDRRDEMRRKAAAQQQIFRDVLSGKRPIPTRSNDTALMAERRPPGLPSLAKERGPEEFPASVVARDQGATSAPGIESLLGPRMSMDDRIKEAKRLNALAGRDPNFMANYEKRIGDIEARRAEERKGEPMDQLAAFLSGIAGSRRGAKFGEAGAAGVAASTKLAAEQKALRDRQELDMAQLQLSIAREKDALAKGDLTTAMAERDRQEKLQLDIFKAKSEDDYRKAQTENQKARLAFDQSQANRLRQMEIVRKYMDNLRSQYGKDIKYFNKPDLLEADVLRETQKAFGADKLADLGLFANAPTQASTGNRPPLSSFNKP